MGEQTKTCTKCGEVKGLDCFRIRNASPDSRTARCKRCLSADEQERKYYVDWRRKNPDIAAAARQRNYARNADRRRAYSRDARSAAAQETRPHATRNGHEWTGPELEAISDYRKTSKELAIQLGRSDAAVRRQREMLRTDPRKIKVAGIPERNEEDS